ncbi:MAG: tRNA pseudouridine(55) synthase TruB [Clostridium sp.]|nr:tRNA pseudouridine(55) synthase TruB [Clostridium sp.]MCM1547470.1 tRNA pseudouridine(55) synthase TruB [Ruminococcus sp.]
MQLSGIIPINKPQGFTSFDVIAKMRGILKMKKLGHSGTLDPMATGVLPVFAGSAAKAISFIPHTGKKYTAGFKLGITSDTQDITGKIISATKTDITVKRLEAAAEKFIGKINQIPPMYSAVSVNGKRLYEYARQGIEVEREAREAVINSLDINFYDEKKSEGIMTVACSGGTYVRTLIHDIGRYLGCGAVMTSLVRIYSNGFWLEECITLEQLEELRDSGEIENIVIPVERLFSDLPEIHLNEKKTGMYKNGVKLRLDKLDGFYGWEKCRVYSKDHEFIGLASADKEKNELRVLKNLDRDVERTENTKRKKTAVALGIFDGIHYGHTLILRKALSHEKYTPAVFTFITESISSKHGKPFEYIYPNRQKLETVRMIGFNYIESFNFESLRYLTGEEFVREILIGKMNAGAVVCGENFRFGKNASCGAADLKAFGEEYGFDVEIITLEKKADDTFSSELIREYLRQGKIRELCEDFNFNYCIENVVSEGNKIGRTLNFPTINQNFAKGQLVLKKGVYSSRTRIDGTYYRSITNIGVKPTVSDSTEPVAETHILDFSGDLYDKTVCVQLLDFMREERKFKSLEELRKQINSDIEKVRKD